MMQSLKHIPVLLNEVISALQVGRGGRYIDCTVGGGGHAQAILKACSPSCKLLGVDADPKALSIAEQNFAPHRSSYILVEGNFKDLEAIALEQGFLQAQGVLFDLGLSSLQLGEDDRGFSFYSDAPLDMRFSPKQKITAAFLVNSFNEDELASLLKDYSEEKKPKKIARAIIANRPFKSSRQLAEAIEKITGKKGKIHPATRVFQALRIAVNNELENLKQGLKQVPQVLAKGGRLVVIAYHSLEDRIVKDFMRIESKGCLCPPGTIACICGHQSKLKIITKKVIKPDWAEIEQNPRSRSARMRVAERI